MEKTNQSKKCARCGGYEPYFIKTYVGFLRQDVGYCNLKQQIVGKDENTCENYRGRAGENIARRKIAAVRVLSAIAQDINMLKTILCDETADREDYIREKTVELTYYLKKYEQEKSK